MRTPRSRLAASALAAALLAAGCSPQPTSPDAEGRSSAVEARAATGRQVVVITLDGLNPDALTRLGRSGAPQLHRMMRQGASTLNARTELEQTETLPNHIGMVTGRRIDSR